MTGIKGLLLMVGVPAATAFMAVTYTLQDYTKSKNVLEVVVLGSLQRVIMFLHEFGHLTCAIFSGGEVISEKYNTDDGTPAHIIARFNGGLGIGLTIMLLGPMLVLWPAAIGLYYYAWTNAISPWGLLGVGIAVPILFVAGTLSPHDFRALGFFGKLTVFNIFVILLNFVGWELSRMDYARIFGA